MIVLIALLELISQGFFVPMLDFDKIFPAFLIAAIVAMLSGFIGKKIVHPHSLKEDAVAIEGDFVATAGPEKAAMPEPILAMIASADVERGAKLSKACAACHSFDKGGVNKVGPNLWNIVNASKAHLDSFSYSTAMAEFEGKWDYDALNHFLWKPKSYMPGTKMNYAGLKKPEDRAAMIAWLRTLSSPPAALPTAADIDSELSRLAPPAEDVVVLPAE